MISRRTILRFFVATVALGCCTSMIAATKVASAPWGSADGVPVELYTMTSDKMEVKVTSYGARIVSLRVPDHSGQLANVIVGPDTLEGFLAAPASVRGATIGRYANRIARGEFVLDGTTYHIPTGRDGNALHGGPVGINHKVWTVQEIKDGVEMTLVSPDGDMGFPGTLSLSVRFTLTTMRNEPALRIDYRANSDKPTVLNLTNHSYFNLSGGAASVVDDVATIDADSYTPVSSSNLPTGSIDPVEGTPFDFRKKHTVGANIPGQGYDNNLVLRSPGLTAPAAEVDDPVSGRTLKLYTTEPGLQLFVPLHPPPGNTSAQPVIQTFCLEPQHFPDAPNIQKFPSTVLRPGTPYRSTSIYAFGK